MMYAKPQDTKFPRLLNDHAGQIIRALKGNESGMCLCPAHDDERPSLHVSEVDGKILLHCFAGCSQENVIAALDSRGLWQKQTREPSFAPTRYELEMQKRDKFRKAWAILRTAASERRTPKTYLNARGLQIVPENALLLSEKQTRKYTNTGLPSMVLPIIGPSGLQGAQVTFLNRNLNANARKFDGKNSRKIYGSASGGYIYAGELDDKKPMIVAEGFETALSAAQLTGLPAVAAISASNMKSNFVPPPCTELIIAADSDEPGRQAAEALASRMSIPVRIAYPPTGDWNDAIRSGDDSGKLKRLLLEAPLFRRENASEPEEDFTAEGPERATDLGNARRLVRLHGKNIRYVHAMNSWFIWKGNRWKRDGNGAIMQIAKRVTEAMFDEAKKLPDEEATAMRRFALATQKRERLAAMVSLAQSERPVILDAVKLDADPMLLGVRNGVIELATGTFRDGKREDYVSKQAGAAFDANATCPNWIAFQEKISGGNRELIAYKRRLAGLLLTGLMEEVLFIAWADGQNGKTTEFETLFELLGDYAIANDASMLMAQKQPGAASPEIVALKGKRALFINETPDNARLNENRVKFLASSDTLSGRNLYEGLINFQPTHKTLLRTNHRPIIRGTDKGIWRRIHLIPFTVTIPDSEKIINFKVERLRPELPGILNWCLEGLADYLANGLQPPACVTGATESYRGDMDLVQQWLDARCLRDDARAETPLKDLAADFNEWAETAGELCKAWPSRRLSDELQRRFGLEKRRSRSTNVDVFMGVSVRGK